MRTRVHYGIEMDVAGVRLNEVSIGDYAVALTFTDKYTGETDIYPIPLDIAKDLGHEIIRVTKKTKKVMKGS